MNPSHQTHEQFKAQIDDIIRMCYIEDPVPIVVSINRLRYSVYGESRWDGDKSAYGAFAFTFHGEQRGQHETWVGTMHSQHNIIQTLSRIAEFHAIRIALRDALGRCPDVLERRPDCPLEVIVYTATEHVYSHMIPLVGRRRDDEYYNRPRLPSDEEAVPYRHVIDQIFEFGRQIMELGVHLRCHWFDHDVEPNLLAKRCVVEKLNEMRDKQESPPVVDPSGSDFAESSSG